MHYEFNIRHMSGVFAGLLKAKPSEFMDAEKLVLLWIHESERIMALSVAGGFGSVGQA